jgi:SSS family solute:Na+ symporter
MNYALLVSFVVYLLIILAIGLFASYRAKSHASSSQTDFLLGGRNTGWFLTALSAHAADMSDWLFMAFPAAVYLTGGYSLWIMVGLIGGMMLVWQCMAARLRTESERYHGVTLGSFLSNRFGDTSGAIAGVAAAISLIFFIIYLSAGLKGIGFVLKSAFNIDYHVGLVVAMAVVLTYTLVGGFTSIAVIDLFQGLFLLSMIVLVPLVAYGRVGGFTAIMDAVHVRGISLSLLPSFDFNTIASIILNPLAWGLGYFGMPHILTKFMGAKNAADLHKGKYVGLVWMLLALSAAALVGIIGLAYFPHGVPEKTELIFVKMTQSMFSPWVAGIILCALLAATISTVDTQLLVLAGIITQDLYYTFWQPRATMIHLKMVYRWALCVAAIFGLCCAWNEESTIMALVQYGWGGLGASFGPIMILALFCNRITKYGALAAMLVGCAVSCLWPFVAPYITAIPVYAIAPAYLCSFLAAYGISYLEKSVR